MIINVYPDQYLIERTISLLQGLLNAPAAQHVAQHAAHCKVRRVAVPAGSKIYHRFVAVRDGRSFVAYFFVQDIFESASGAMNAVMSFGNDQNTAPQHEATLYVAGEGIEEGAATLATWICDYLMHEKLPQT